MPVTRIDNVTVWTGERSQVDGEIVVSDSIAFGDSGVLALGEAARALAARTVSKPRLVWARRRS